AECAESRSVEARVAQLAGSCGREVQRSLTVGDPLQRSRELRYTRLHPRTNVVSPVVDGMCPGQLGLGEQEVGCDDVSHVDVVPGLLSIAEHREGLLTGELRREDRDDARLSVGVLPRP